MHEAESSTSLLNYIYEYNYIKLSLSHLVLEATPPPARSLALPLQPISHPVLLMPVK